MSIAANSAARTLLGMAIACGMLALSACRNHDFPEYPANYREFAYVSNGGSNTVSVYDVVHVRLDREIQVGQNPSGVTANPRRNEIYVVNSGLAQGNGSISVIDAEKNAVVATIPVHRQPYFLDVNATGNLAYVANSGSNSVSVIDLDTRREIAVAGAGESPGLARISPDGKTLVVTNRLGNSVSIFDTSQPGIPHVRKVIEGCPGATDAVILPDSSKAFAACSSGRQIMAIALARGADPSGPARPDALEAMLDVGRSPVHLALKPDGGELFVSNFDSNTISEVVTGTDDVGGAYLMGSHPVHGLVSADNSLLYVSNFASRELSVYSIDDGKRIALPMPLRVGDGPDGLAFSSSGTLLFCVDARSGDVAVIRTSDRSLFTLLPTGRQPNAIVIKAFRLAS
ncbi:MAG TPA: YncE family protein [Acidobacteriaceae bacterium]|nr:YncE family protein [Acidobacteriaceae bacterium]